MATTAEIAELIRPFTNARLNRLRDVNGYMVPRLTGVDILHLSHSLDADVRGVTDEGVSIFFYSGYQLIPWADITAIRVFAMDGNGHLTGAQTLEHDALRRAA